MAAMSREGPEEGQADVSATFILPTQGAGHHLRSLILEDPHLGVTVTMNRH